ncbi:MAG: sigma-70 family RNA polymerase sigma factor [Bacteroidota bacterium]|nr:sigma-70 family RNA polymerase sigma factor [Bacteroidota bacterium]
MNDFADHSDEELVKLLSESSESAFNELYERFWEPLFTKAYNFLREEDAARDAVQDVFIWLWQHRHSVHIDHVCAYLHQAVRFQALKILRERKHIVPLNDRLSDLTLRILEGDGLQYKELKILLHKTLCGLPADQRLIFILHREDGLTYLQIAAKLGISVKTVEKKMSRSLRVIRFGLKDALPAMLLAHFF